jgi:hypothetical protein
MGRAGSSRSTGYIGYSRSSPGSFHDVRVDSQLATGTLVPDVVQSQTLQDFTRWKSLGVLQPYKPAGFSKVYPGFKDPDGAWAAIAVYAFSYVYDESLGSAATATPSPWSPRITQGAHVISGVAAIPLLLAKLWSVYPHLFIRPPLRPPGLYDRDYVRGFVVALFAIWAGVLVGEVSRRRRPTGHL